MAWVSPWPWGVVGHKCGLGAATAVGGAVGPAAVTTAGVTVIPMDVQVLFTHHHREAMANAAERGFWMPLPLRHAQLRGVAYLTAISRGQSQIQQLVEVAGFEPWRDASGAELWLPFLGQRLELPRPIRLGHRRLLQGWLPQHPQQCQLVPLDALLVAKRLSDCVAQSCCQDGETASWR